jgi:Domain of unknown function (DUF4136)
MWNPNDNSGLSLCPVEILGAHMNRTTVFLALTCVLFPVAAQKVRVDYDHSCNFSRYRTYRWVPAPEGQFLNQLMQERVKAFIEEALAARQLKRVESGEDLRVSYQTTLTQQDQYTTFTNGFGPDSWGFGWGSSISVTTVQPILLGTLVIDMTDARQKRLVFQGVSTATLSSRPARNTRRFASGVRKIFDKYPPR